MGSKPKVSSTPKTQKAKKKKTKEKSQRERFIEAARAAGVDESGEEFERLFQKVMPPKSHPPR